MKLLLCLPAAAACFTLSAPAFAQVIQMPGPPTNPICLDLDMPAVPSGPILPTAPEFTAVGITSVTQVGTWTNGGDTLTPGSNVTGQALVSSGGVMSVAGPGEALDNPGAGAGWDILLASAQTEFSVLFVDQINMTYEVELFLAGTSIGIGTFTYTGSFPLPAHYWTGPGAFDRVLITFPSGTGGVGINEFSLSCGAGVGTVLLPSWFPELDRRGHHGDRQLDQRRCGFAP